MAYKVGTTIVIDDSGNVDWSRISNKPAIGAGDITSVGISNGTPASGVKFVRNDYQITTYSVFAANRTTTGNCNCTANCYVESLSGGGTSGAVTITANRKYFNCNCNCNCRC